MIEPLLPVIIPLLIYLAGREIAIFAWGSRVNTRLSVIETKAETNSSKHDALENRLNVIDEHGTRRLQLLEDRQQLIMRRLEQIAAPLDEYTRIMHRLDRMLEQKERE